jgi:hypothetical protein
MPELKLGPTSALGRNRTNPINLTNPTNPTNPINPTNLQTV